MGKQISLVVAAMLVVACGESNPPELNEKAQKAADAYCDCVNGALTKPAPELAKTKFCETEDKAFNDAWAALPVAGRDKKAEPIHTFHSECWNLLSDARGKAMAAENK